jgi:hypothetical protein
MYRYLLLCLVGKMKVRELRKGPREKEKSWKWTFKMNVERNDEPVKILIRIIVNKD